jgi:hypothetical protein
VKTGGLRSRSASDQHRYDRFSVPTTFAAMRARVTRRRSLAAETESGSRLVIKLRLARPLPPEWRARAFSTFCSNSRRHHAMIDSRAATSPLLYRSPGFYPAQMASDERRLQRDALPDTRNIWPRSANQRVDRGPSEALRRADTSFPEVSYAAGGQRGRALNGSCRHEASRI